MNTSARPDLPQEESSSKLVRKSRESPFMVVGLVGCALACAYGAYHYKHRGVLSTSNYLMQLRVSAQGAVIGCLTIGIAYSLFRRIMPKSEKGET